MLSAVGLLATWLAATAACRSAATAAAAGAAMWNAARERRGTALARRLTLLGVGWFRAGAGSRQSAGQHQRRYYQTA